MELVSSQLVPGGARVTRCHAVAGKPVVGAGVIQRDREWEFFFDPVELRFARLQVDEYLGDSVAINHVEIRSTEQTFIPTKVDVSTLAQTPRWKLPAAMW